MLLLFVVSIKKCLRLRDETFDGLAVQADTADHVFALLSLNVVSVCFHLIFPETFFLNTTQNYKNVIQKINHNSQMCVL